MSMKQKQQAEANVILIGTPDELESYLAEHPQAEETAGVLRDLVVIQHAKIQCVGVAGFWNSYQIGEDRYKDLKRAMNPRKCPVCGHDEFYLRTTEATIKQTFYDVDEDGNAGASLANISDTATFMEELVCQKCGSLIVAHEEEDGSYSPSDTVVTPSTEPTGFRSVYMVEQRAVGRNDDDVVELCIQD